MGLVNNHKKDEFFQLVHLYIQEKSARKHILRDQILENAIVLMNSLSGLETLFCYAPQLDKHNFFFGSPWENIENLHPPLVRGTLEAEDKTAAAEVISNLRILAIVCGIYLHPIVNPEKARAYLDEVIGLNLDALYMPETEEARVNYRKSDMTANLLLKFITHHYSFPGALEFVIREIDKLSVQRPIITDKIESLIASGLEIVKSGHKSSDRLNKYNDAVNNPTFFSKYYGEYYPKMLAQFSQEILANEAEQFSLSMEESGLVAENHVCLLRHLNSHCPELISTGLGLGAAGKKTLLKNLPLIQEIINISVTLKTKHTIYGLSRMLERDIFTVDVISSLELLLATPPCSSIDRRIKLIFHTRDESCMKACLLSGIIHLLGQPLGVGQGFNPTCQSTRALSYWSQTNPLFLLEMYRKAISENAVSVVYEGSVIPSSSLKISELDFTIPMDPVSVILVPHLDVIYGEMLNRTGFRGEDAHKWVNPGFYGSGVLEGFADIYNCAQFLSKFYEFYHPSSVKNILRLLPQPAGVLIFDQSGKSLGAHAILIQRVGEDLQGNIRVYFYNPNNDSCQKWGKDMEVSVSGNGELEGEASLLYYQFSKCLYAFHFSPAA